MVTPVAPRLIAVCGVPGAGKTTLARGLGLALHLPVVVRDDIKTGIADTSPELDWSDPGVRADVGGRAFAAFHRLLHAHLDATSALVAEAAWHWALADRELVPVLRRARATVVHVVVEQEIAAARFRARFEAGERHASHVDGAFADQMGAAGYDWQHYLPPPDLPCRQVAVDGALAPAALLARTLDAIGAEG